MNRPVFVVLGIACFAAGWWADAWAGHAIREADDPKPDAAPAGQTLSAGGGSGAPSRSPGLGTVRSLDELRALALPGRPNASLVRMDEALAGLSAAELAELAEKLKPAVNPHDADEIHPARLAVLQRWLAVEPGAAAEHVLSSFGREVHLPSGLWGALGQAIAGFVPQDFARAVGLMNRIHNRDTYIMVRLEVVHSLEGMEAEAATKLQAEFDLKTRNDRHLASVRGDEAARWAARDGAAAMEWALHLPPGYTRDSVLEDIADGWAKADAAAMAAYLSTAPEKVLPEGRLRRYLLRKAGAADPSEK